MIVVGIAIRGPSCAAVSAGTCDCRLARPPGQADATTGYALCNSSGSFAIFAAIPLALPFALRIS